MIGALPAKIDEGQFLFSVAEVNSRDKSVGHVAYDTGKQLMRRSELFYFLKRSISTDRLMVVQVSTIFLCFVDSAESIIFYSTVAAGVLFIRVV